ncbi:3-hydroxyisobutyrate dehydrogenase-like beta-hydroxyacid dehydrogenase [Herbihabitans rhizosphaerae]|uniref:3-hydroxyisobutyrate dehydrogenase-like beta-hydroxyacid dehydrogenase n=1 Tax=Herbihabitans rhizosphaerae TaxID=1872711 RepID=A0A4V2ETF0_9PSEU|nr:NAD(P)-binding domain-containing protein [Herbihabitans rhizosphaerae]RZS40843.1 3-hydroxyisobutyrate dehydrogenase-like beta-hydroxyacid dehydrogenase [Herbihabitans rhizosphaerae]
MMKVSVIGLGLMGAALARAMLADGRSTTVWNRTAARAGALVAEGAVRAGTVADACASDLVIVCVLDHDAVWEVLRDGEAALPGRTLVNLTTGTPAQARAVAVWAAERGITYLDGGIMASPSMIHTPHATVLYSGSEAAFDRHRGTLETLGTTVFLGSDAGHASAYDLAMLCGMYGMLGGLFQGIALAGAEGITPTAFTERLLPFLRATIAFLPDEARAIEAGDHSTKENSLAMQSSGFRTFAAACADAGVPFDLVAPVRDLVDRRVADGFGEDGLSSVVELLRAQ